jgi:anthranilate synthase component 1
MKYRYEAISNKILGDMHTPVSVYLKVRDIYPESLLLESSDFHGNENSLSYIALCPMATFSVANDLVRALYPGEKEEITPLSEQYTLNQSIDHFMDHFEIAGDAAHTSGLFGYTAFDAIRHLEPSVHLMHKSSEIEIPDIRYILFKYLIIFDHFKSELTLVELVAPGEKSTLNQIKTLIENRNYASYNFTTIGQETSTLSDNDFCSIVRKGISHCHRGDVFQIVLSRRFEQSFRGDDFKVYRALRHINPSPYLFYFDFGGFKIFGSSPETHCKITNRHISIDPIAGTAFRTGNSTIDRNRVEALLTDPKENAEHVMLVDLARNDLSRHAQYVKVDFFREVQYYSHVIHLVSRVSGDILPEDSTTQAFLDTFPAGTLSGAPKARAMQLIHELEPHQRSSYGGCIGFLGFDGSVNQAITIRSFLSKNNKLFYQAGAGIVAASDEQRELQEVNNKLGALKKAIVMAEELKN